VSGADGEVLQLPRWLVSPQRELALDERLACEACRGASGWHIRTEHALFDAAAKAHDHEEAQFWVWIRCPRCTATE